MSAGSVIGHLVVRFAAALVLVILAAGTASVARDADQLGMRRRANVGLTLAAACVALAGWLVWA